MANALYVDNVLHLAAAEIGYKEKATNAMLDDPAANAGTGNWTKYARDLWEAAPHFYQGNKNSYDWCAVFVDWCLFKACGDAQKAQDALCYTGPYGAGCKSSVMYYKEAGRFHTGTPLPGDQIFFNDPPSHTGIVEKVEDGIVYTIEGNSNNQVRRRYYPLDTPSIYGYGRPKYDGAITPAETDVDKDHKIAELVRQLFALLNG